MKRHKKYVEMDLNKRGMRKHEIHVTHTPYQPNAMEVVYSIRYLNTKLKVPVKPVR